MNNREIFQDTIEKCETNFNWMLDECVNNYYPEDYFQVPKIDRYKKKSNIKLVRMTSVQAIERFGKSKNYSVLNFASAKNPGGGVLKGHFAQEESLCRTSCLYPMLVKCVDFYNPRPEDPFFTDKIIYTSSVYFFKNDFGEYMEPIKCDVITCAAPSYAFYDYDRVDPLDHQKVITKRFTKVILSAIENKSRNLILGAWGCGVFLTPPEINSSVFRDVLDQYADNFDEVIFAIPDFTNYHIFESVLIS